ncbi:hypothetical protein TNCV_1295191 [Trichonephila clavipes]|nr:hypothetical protein TNCV_1295191 [Trichonephila clavipes]
MEEVCSLRPASFSTLGVWRSSVNYFWRQQVENLSINKEGSIDLGVERTELLVVGAGQGMLLGGWLEGGRYGLLQGVWSVSSASSIVKRDFPLQGTHSETWYSDSSVDSAELITDETSEWDNLSLLT